MAKRYQITADEVRRLFHYDPETGVFTWRIDRRMGRTGKGRLVAAAGAVAGGVCKSTGYLQVNTRQNVFHMHRLAFLYMTGAWPAGQVDHRDNNRTNNAWTNLRDVPARVNRQNLRSPRADNKLGIQGVQRTPSGKFRARVSTDGVTTRLGLFLDPHEAHAAYVTAKRQQHEGCTI